MNDGFFSWYRTGWGMDAAGRLLSTAVSAGLHVVNPGNQRVSLITNGPDSWGEQVFVTEHALLEHAALSAGTEVNFQLWLNSECDVFTRVRRLDGEDVVALEFGLDGMTGEEQEHTVAVLTRMLRGDFADCFGFVVDRRGVSEELDWDGVFSGEAVHVAPLPDTFGLLAKHLATHPELDPDQAVRNGDLAVFGRSG